MCDHGAVGPSRDLAPGAGRGSLAIDRAINMRVQHLIMPVIALSVRMRNSNRH
jgi:hypothetical protein